MPETASCSRTYHCLRSMRILAHSAILAGFTLTLMAQGNAPTSPAAAKREPPPGPLRSIHVTGNTTYSAEAIVAASGLKVGQRITQTQIEQARKKLQDFEVFNSVAFEYRTTPVPPPQYDVTFQVVENPNHPAESSRVYTNPWIVEHRHAGHVELVNLDGSPAGWPPTNMVLIATKPML